MVFKKIKILLLSILLMFTASSLFAVEEYVSEIYKELDLVFAEKSETKLNSILSRYSQDKYYYLIENYTEKKIRHLIVNKNYDFAMEAIVIVIDNNLDNEGAVEMYSLISDAYDIQKKKEAEIEYQKQLELARIENEKEKQRGDVEKEYVSAKTASGGKSVYVSGKETNLTNYKWKANLGLADLLWLSDSVSGINSIHYGPSADINYKYTLKNKSILGADLFAGVQFLSIAEEENLVPLIGDFDIGIKFATAKMANLFIRAGFGYMLTGKSDTATNTDSIAQSMYTPEIGIRFEELALGGAKIDAGADWYAGHLFTSNINFAMGACANIQLPFAELEKVSLSLNVGVRDKFLLKEDGIENRASLILAIGAENVIR